MTNRHFFRFEGPDDFFSFPSSQISGRWCQKCAREFQTIKDYQWHLFITAVHHVCQYCTDYKDYDSLANLRIHWEACHGAKYCEYCFRHFCSTADKQKHFEHQHYLCESCMEWFPSKGHRRYHWIFSEAHKYPHPKSRGQKPRERSNDQTQENETRQDQTQEDETRKDNPETGNSRNFHQDSNFKNEKKKSSPPKSAEWNSEKPNAGSSKKPSAGSSKKHSANVQHANKPPNHYAMLEIPSHSSAVEIAIASRRKRIEVHPDRLKRKQGLSPKQLQAIDIKAKNVGFAAEVLGDQDLRRQYDRIYRRWYSDSR